MGKKKRVSESSEKAEKLKSLNKMLLKETSENRKQVNSMASQLTHLLDNDYVIITELDKTIISLCIYEQLTEKFIEQIDSLRMTYSKVRDTITKFVELERDLETQKGLVVEHECEIGMLKDKLSETELGLRRTCVERDEFKGLLDCQVVVKKRVLFALRKRNGVRKRVKDGGFELRKRNRELGREIGELRDALVGEKELMERIGCLVRGKDLVEMSCVKLGEDLRRKEEELCVVVREMGVVREAKDVEVGKRCKLVNVVSGLNETVVGLREEKRRLLVNVEVLENRCVEGEEKRKLMGKKIDRLLEDRKCKEKRIEGMMDEKITVEKKLQETLTRLRNVNCKLEFVVKQNDGLVEAKVIEVGKRCELETGESELNETMVGLQEEEQRLLVNVAKVEDKCVENEEKQRVVQKKVGLLLEEKKSNEKSIEGLMDDQIMLEKKLQETLIQLHNEKCRLEHFVKNNVGLLEAKCRLDCDVTSFQKQVAELKIVNLRLEGSNKVRESNFKSLETEVGNYTCKLKCVEAERIKLGNCLHEEKQNVVTLKKRIENMEMKLEESVKSAGAIKAENGTLLVEKIDLENQCGSLKNEIASLKSALDKAQDEGNVAQNDSESELVNNMLALTFCLKDGGESKDGDLTGKGTSCGEAKRSGKKFEMIKKFLSRLKRQKSTA